MLPDHMHNIVSDIIKKRCPCGVDLVRRFEGSTEVLEILGFGHKIRNLLIEVNRSIGVLPGDPVVALFTPTEITTANVNGKVSFIMGNLRFKW